MDKKPLTVTALTKYLKYTFDHDVNLQNIYLKGEISNFKHHGRGHFYFTLKDEAAQISAVMFQSNAKNIDFTVENGLNVIVEGYVSVYPAGGSYQVYVTNIIVDGIGALYLKYEQLKEKLQKQGLFDDRHKKPIPRFPAKIAVITSDTGAAIKDIITTIERRYKSCEVIVFPTLVQGNRAKHSIIDSLKKANQYGQIDTIILGRGGGSIEDLWCFNEEEVAMAIYQSEIPIISAVGHETDFTISDFISDIRAATPTAAAEIAVPNTQDVLMHLENQKQRMHQSLFNHVNNRYDRLNRIKQSVVFAHPRRIFEQSYFQVDKLASKLEQNSPKAKVELAQEKLTTLKQRLTYGFQTKFTHNQHRFMQLVDKLELVNPLSLLTKGYSIVQKEEVTIKSIAEVNKDDQLKILLHDGFIECLVTDKEGEKNE